MSRGTSIVSFMGILAIFITTVKPAVAFTAYDCGGKLEKLTSISLIDVNTECDREIKELTKSFEDFAVLQLINYDTLQDDIIDSPWLFCLKKSFDKLLIGKGTGPDPRGIFNILDVDGNSYSFKTYGSEEYCGAKFWRMEKNGLYIVERKYLANLDVLLLVNPDYKHILQNATTQVPSPSNIQAKKYLTNLNLKKQNCELQKEVLKNKLALASTNPEEFAFRLMGGPGYTGIVAGEVVRVMKCGPVTFQLRETNKCYDRLPIRIEDKELFMKPLSHIITEHAAEVPCDPIVPEHYKVQGTWYKFSPEPVSAPQPMKLKLGSEIEWTHDFSSEWIL